MTKELDSFVPTELKNFSGEQSDIPLLAKDAALMSLVENAVTSIPTRHQLFNCDARQISFIDDESAHLVLTSPPYWTLKKYNDNEQQMGHIDDYKDFIYELNKVWSHALRVLVPGGRLICVVGDVCLSRKKHGRHAVIPLHARIQESCVELGFDNLMPIFWHKIANANYEASGSGGGFLGKPYEPNGVIKNDIEFILMFRKPGGYRSPSFEERLLSTISSENHKSWFVPVWHGVNGASTRQHPAPYPVELADRLIRMFSFVGDTVMDPFSGTATTSVAASQCGRNSVGIELDPDYFKLGHNRLKKKTSSLLKTEVQSNLLGYSGVEQNVKEDPQPIFT